MATTPEGKIKKMVKAVLDRPDVYLFMPVQNGFGAVTLDFLGSHKGRFFAIETKAPGKKPTALQELTISRMEAGGAKVFVVKGQNEITALVEWLDQSPETQT